MSIKLSQTNYRSLIPFRILLDLDLSANALRMYGIIEQMESATNKVYFTFRYLADELGIEIRWAKQLARELKDKGYIEHIEYKPGHWLWRTKKEYPVEMIEPEVISDDEGGAVPVHGGVQSDCTGGVQCQTTHTINIQTTNNQPTTTSGSSASQVREEEPIINIEADSLLWRENLGKPTEAKDKREFLAWCKFWMEHECKAPDEPSKLRVLISIIRKGGLAKPRGFVGDVIDPATNAISDEKYRYQGYLMTVTGDLKWGRLPEGFIPMSFHVWINSGMPSREKDIIN